MFYVVIGKEFHEFKTKEEQDKFVKDYTKDLILFELGFEGNKTYIEVIRR